MAPREPAAAAERGPVRAQAFAFAGALMLAGAAAVWLPSLAGLCVTAAQHAAMLGLAPALLVLLWWLW